MNGASKPTTLLPTRTGGRLRHSTKTKPRLSVDTITWTIFLFASCFVSFYAGIWVAWSLSASPQQEVDYLNDSSSSRFAASTDCSEMCFNAVLGGKGDLARRLEGKLDAIVRARVETALKTECPSSSESSNSKWSKRFPDSLSHFANGLISINRKDMFDKYDFGVPMDGNAENENILMLYDSKAALPPFRSLAAAAEFNGDIPQTDATTATANCDVMSAIFVKNFSTKVRQCLAIVGGQYQGYHVQRWARLVGEGDYGTFDNNAPLRMAGRMLKIRGLSSGADEFVFPDLPRLQSHREILLNYLTNLEKIQVELSMILHKISINNTVIVSTVNKGQSELLINFVCSARSRGLDISNLIIFPTDLYSKELAESMGLATFYSHELMKSIPSHEAEKYGDRDFALIMMAKVICVHLVCELGFDLLFQKSKCYGLVLIRTNIISLVQFADVDVVWFKNPLDYFQDKTSAIANFDIYFQDDGNREERFSPYSANSGFYFARSNERTTMLFRRMMYAGEIVLSSRSHQEILIQQLADLNELIGLKVKVLNRKDHEFPGGYHFNHVLDDNFMRNFVAGKSDPYIFHMSWTLNKIDKLKYLKQMGMWFVKDECAGETDAGDDVIGGCCSTDPEFSCHYRDKPSIKSCASSPLKDANGQSFW